MACAYGAGASVTLHEWKVEASHILGGSGSAGGALYWAAKQIDQLADVWTRQISDPRFINIRRFWRMIDIDILVDILFKEENPLDIAALRESCVKSIVSATNAHTGKVEFFDDWHETDPYDALRASKAMPLPFLYGKRVEVNEKWYIDTYNSSRAALLSREVCSRGVDKLLVIDNYEAERFNHLIFGAWLGFQRKVFREGYLDQRTVRETHVIGVESYTIRPMSKLRVKTLTNDACALEATFMQGYEETKRDDDLKRFLEL